MKSSRVGPKSENKLCINLLIPGGVIDVVCVRCAITFDTESWLKGIESYSYVVVAILNFVSHISGSAADEPEPVQ